MKRTSTDALLTLGMALYADKRVMERRIRGIFGRRRTAGPAGIAAALVCLMLGFTCFTTACVPEVTGVETNETMSAERAEKTPPPAAAPEAVAGAPEQSPEEDKARMLEQQRRMLENARSFTAPRVYESWEAERGTWTVQADADPSRGAEAAALFVQCVNPVFYTAYAPEEMKTVFHKDETGFRSDLWRVTSADGLVAGAVTDKDGKLAFLSATCGNPPGDERHASLSDVSEKEHWLEKLDTGDAAKRITEALGGSPMETVARGGGSYSNSRDYGWSVQEDIAIRLTDGSYYIAVLYGDAKQTVEAFGVCPDEACVQEGAFWRADLKLLGETVQVKDPKDFRKGKPGPEDMPEQEAYAFYYAFVNACNNDGTEDLKEPNATFYVDYSGVRENYWHIEGQYLIFDLTARTKHLLGAYTLRDYYGLGYSMGLMEIPYEQMGNQAYLDATEKLFQTLFGEGSVKEVRLNAVYDGHYCTVDPVMADGTAYEIMYEDGLVREVAFFEATDDSGWGRNPGWKADWIYVNTETGETFEAEW